MILYMFNVIQWIQYNKVNSDIHKFLWEMMLLYTICHCSEILLFWLAINCQYDMKFCYNENLCTEHSCFFILLWTVFLLSLEKCTQAKPQNMWKMLNFLGVCREEILRSKDKEEVFSLKEAISECRSRCQFPTWRLKLSAASWSAV